jgi:hypothetical protein
MLLFESYNLMKLNAIVQWVQLNFLVYCLMCNFLMKLIVVGLMFDACILLKLNVNGLMM